MKLPKLPKLTPDQVDELVLCLIIGFLVLAAGLLFSCDAHAAGEQYRRGLTRAAHLEWGLDAPVSVFAAQIHQESGWNPDAVSRVGAAGMAQFMPATARWWCSLTGSAAADCQPRNPTWAMRALVGYDKWLWQRIPPGTAFDRMWATLRAYNGGLGHWQAEARGAVGATRAAIDAACGSARRNAVHCPENLGYPRRILLTLQPRYAGWGPGVAL